MAGQPRPVRYGVQVDPVADFIRREAVRVVERWEGSARQLPELAHMTRPVLFDHMFELLDGLAAWIEGQEVAARRGFDALIDGHALQRLGHGVSLSTLIGEYKALRSILLTELLAVPSSDAVRASLVRLDQGFDDAFGNSLHHYEQAREQQRERFISILGHDLRQPLGVIALAADTLTLAAPGLDDLRAMARRLQTASERMARLVEDVLDFARSRLGNGIPVDPSLHDMAEICRAAVDELLAAHPAQRVHLEISGDLRGAFDRERILQALGNLLANAVVHGTGALEVLSSEAPDHRAVIVEVRSHGRPISEDILRTIFDPFATTSPRRGLGLGMYIVQQIARAHGGTCEVSSDERATVFRLHFPRSPSDARLEKAMP